MIVAGKVWGQTAALFNKNNVEIHRIEVAKGGVCSLHRHLHKHNAFFVESGTLIIEVQKNDYALTDKTILTKGKMTSVPPGEYHRFVAVEDTVAYEIYWTEISTNDIERKDVGFVNSEG